MRLLLASLAAIAAVTFAGPASAQSDVPPAATPAPVPSKAAPAKPKVGTLAYCNTLKTPTAKSACIKRVQAHASAAKTPATPKAKPKKLEANKPADTSAQLTTPTATPAPAPTPPQTITVPPLPQKTI